MGATAVGAALGLLKNYDEQQKAKHNSQVQGTIAAYSPWTGMQAKAVEAPSAFGNVLQGATSGYGMGQNIAQSQAQDAMAEKQGKLVDAQAAYVNSLQNPQGSAGALGANMQQKNPFQSPWGMQMQPEKQYGPY